MPWLDRHQPEMRGGQPAQSFGLCEKAEFSLQHVDLLLLGGDAGSQATELFLQSAYPVGYGEQHGGERHREQQTKRRAVPCECGPATHAALFFLSVASIPAPRHTRRTHPGRPGSRILSDFVRRGPDRPLVEQAETGLGLDPAISGRCRDALGGSPLRSLRKFFTFRSSSE